MAPQGDGSFNSYQPNLKPLMGGAKTTDSTTRTTADGASSSTPATAEQIARRAAELVGGDRQKTHGDKIENHQNIAALWNAYLGWRLDDRLTPKDVTLMMVLLKVARTKSGDHNPDDYVDAAGYAAVAGEIAGAGK